mmetsp:Transcript_101601/g.287889  ORF Transcript_101601/g.287889 Transcript_101601/m.287889 type:complete len:245 (-) Transcript_101601:264-998(-)
MAIFTSCTATPDVSKMVRRGSPGPLWSSGRSSASPSSTTEALSISPSAAACWNSPRSNVCALLSQTRRSAAATRLASSSCLPGVSAPTAVMCVPARTHSRRTTGDRADVTVWIRVLPRTTSSAEPHRASQPSADTSRQNRAACSASRLCTRTRRHGVTAFRNRSCHRAWTPAPIRPIVETSAGHQQDEASADAAAVRISVRSPSSKRMASSRAVLWLRTSISPLLTGRPRWGFSCTPPGATLMT